MLSHRLYPRQEAAKVSGEDSPGHGFECKKVKGLRKLTAQIRLLMSEKPRPRKGLGGALHAPPLESPAWFSGSVVSGREHRRVETAPAGHVIVKPGRDRGPPGG